MEIISKNGADYLVTYVAKLNNHELDASCMFMDIQETIQGILKRRNTKHKTKKTFIDKKEYGYSLQAILNRFSGDYFSPSFLKNYITNPALCLFSTTFKEEANDAAAVGTTFHKIMEMYYNLPQAERDRSLLWELEKQALMEGQDKSKVDAYLDGFIPSGDYLGGKMDDKKLKCDTEKYGRALITVKSLNYTLPSSTAYIIDRIDYRDDGIYIIDYKTGHPKAAAATFDGYLGSMLIYKWALEQELGIQIKGSYLMTPGNKDKWMELDFSTENEKKMVEIIEGFTSQFNKDNRRRVYSYTDEGYFTTDDARRFKATMIDNTIWMAKIPIELYIGKTEDSI